MFYSYHHLKLYPEDESGLMSTKKPVLVESYDEIVFTEPWEGFRARVQDHRAVIMPRLLVGFSLPPSGILIFFTSSHLQNSRHVKYMLANIVYRFSSLLCTNRGC